MNPEEWMQHGACVGEDPDLFFPERGTSTATAKAICAGCEVRVTCLCYALSEGIKHGIWGGTSERERRKMRRRRFEMLDGEPVGFRHLAAVEDA